MEQQSLMFQMLQKNEHRALKKMIKEYASLQKSFHHKLIYDPCEISSRETETLTQQIQDLEISFMNLTEDLKNVEAYQTEAALIMLFELIKQSYHFSIKLKNQNQPDAQAKSKPMQESLCINCMQNTQKILISKMKQSFLITQTTTSPTKQINTELNSIEFLRQSNEYREYLLEGNAFVKKIQQALSSKARTLVSGAGQMAKSYLFLLQNTKNMRESESAKNFIWKQTKFQSQDSNQMIEKLKNQFIRSFIQSIRYPMFRLLSKFQGNGLFQSSFSPTFQNVEVQTQAFSESDRIRYLQTDNNRLYRQLQFIKHSKSQIQAESINYIKKQAAAQQKVIQFRKQNMSLQDKNKILEDQIQVLEEKLKEQKKWREADKQFFIQPFRKEIKLIKESQERLQRELYRVRNRLNQNHKSQTMKSTRNQKVTFEKDEESLSEQFFPQRMDNRRKTLKVQKIKSAKKIDKKKNLKEKLRIETCINSIISEPQKHFRLKRENSKKTRISYVKDLNQTERNERSFQDDQLKLKFLTRQTEKKERKQSKFKHDILENQQNSILKKNQSVQIDGDEQFFEFNDREQEKVVKTLKSPRMPIKDMKQSQRLRNKLEQRQAVKLVQITKQHLYLFGGEKMAYEYEKNIGIWPHLNSTDKLVLDFENTHFSNQIQKYFQFLAWIRPQKFLQYGEFLVNPLVFLAQQKKKNESTDKKLRTCIPNVSKEKDRFNFKLIFNKLIRFHRVCHRNCSHVLTFLEEVGFSQI